MSVSDRRTIIFNPMAGKQLFCGWGTSLCWWSNVLGQWQNEAQIEKICRLLFSAEGGLGINFVRYNLGAGTNPPNKAQLRTGADLPCCLPSSDEWDMAADWPQQRILTYAVKNGVSLVEAFLNSPPLWMTRSNSTAGAADGLCNLREDCFDLLADYLVTAAEKLSAMYGLQVHALAPFNEPVSFWWKSGNDQEGCHFDVRQQSLLIEKIAKLINKRRLDLQVSAPECWSTYETIYACNHYPPEVIGCIGQINTHTYFSDEQSRKELRALAERLRKPLWMSEVSCGGTSVHCHDDMSGALELAENITLHLNEMGAVGWVYWQAVENELLNHNHGLIHAEFEGEENYYLTKQYYAFAHYSKFIRPGYTLLSNNREKEVLLAKSPDDTRFVMVAYNSSADAVVLHPRCLAQRTFSPVEIYQTTKTENLISISSTGQDILLPAESIATIIFE